MHFITFGREAIMSNPEQSCIFDERQIRMSEAAGISFAKDFKSERDFCDFIEYNIDAFIDDNFDLAVGSYQRECSSTRIMTNNRRVDFFVSSVCQQNIIIECKVPQNPSSDLPKAIGQLLSYHTDFLARGEKIDKIVLLSTKYCSLAAKMIENYRLPIDFIIMDKSKRLKVCLHPEATSTL